MTCDLFEFARDMTRTHQQIMSVHNEVMDRLLLMAPSATPEPSGASLRDEGAQRVLDRAGDDWRDKAIALIIRTHAGSEGIAEDFRNTCESHGIFAHHPNAWGALTLHMKRKGMLCETGEWRSPKDNKSHARPTRVYRVMSI